MLAHALLELDPVLVSTGAAWLASSSLLNVPIPVSLRITTVPWRNGDRGIELISRCRNLRTAQRVGGPG